MLIDDNKPAQLSQNEDYDQLLAADPGLGPAAANEEPTQEEQAHFDMLYADFTDELYGAQKNNAEQMLKSAPDLFKGVSKVAFTILKAVYQRHEQRDGPVPEAALFGEGGVISTAVDEVFSMAQSLQLEGAQDQDQYTAAQMDIMRQVGDFIEKKQDDDAVNESQEMLLDMDEAAGGSGEVAPLNAEENDTLNTIGQDPAQAGVPAPEFVPGDPNTQGAVPPQVQPPVPGAQGGLV